MSASAKRLSLGGLGVRSHLGCQVSPLKQYSLGLSLARCRQDLYGRPTQGTLFYASNPAQGVPKLRQAVLVVVGYSILVRSVSSGPRPFAVSIPCTMPSSQVPLGSASRGSRVQLRG
ncbi:hypothetical protein IQ273_16200 [Nodosilinea sp. LEGE 07298]|uniref:hypothetical protein n=1 Tax=Nodosilinea sp. LEGE 07298 TaxID=2777970 RepID=UPI00187F502F|nr:hypothetical protein [Nodosilinea sp. LEGE 07298]MBE9110953.1 hypothetical protein [Nodosilinea sp. LEGE 07298]